MAGYVISIGKNITVDDLKKLISDGVYGTQLNVKKTWTQQNEGTLTDYLSMKPGDHIYFFQQRKIYGVGELIKVGNHDCKILNYKNADDPIYKISNNKDMILDDPSIRFICTFKPAPNFFEDGIDMDYVLQSDPEAFKMLRVFWKLSFIKIDDIEDRALFDIILRKNEDFLFGNRKVIRIQKNTHDKISSKPRNDLNISINNFIQESRKKETEIFKREMSLEAAVMERLSTTDIFGHWDYLSHQVVASPMKPVDYMDKMDIFGYRYIQGYKTISKYLVMELKKDKIGKEVVDQTMKYVDWVNKEYSFGDFEMIEAIIIANDFEEDVIEHCNEIAVRSYTKYKPAVNKEWRNLKLYIYRINEKNELVFTQIN